MTEICQAFHTNDQEGILFNALGHLWEEIIKPLRLFLQSTNTIDKFIFSEKLYHICSVNKISKEVFLLPPFSKWISNRKIVYCVWNHTGKNPGGLYVIMGYQSCIGWKLAPSSWQQSRAYQVITYYVFRKAFYLDHSIFPMHLLRVKNYSCYSQVMAHSKLINILHFLSNFSPFNVQVLLMQAAEYLAHEERPRQNWFYSALRSRIPAAVYNYPVCRCGEGWDRLLSIKFLIFLSFWEAILVGTVWSMHHMGTCTHSAAVAENEKVVLLAAFYIENRLR